MATAIAKGLVARFAAAAALASRGRIPVAGSAFRLWSSLVQPAAPEKQSDVQEGYEAWWRQWKEHREQLPKVTVGDVLNFQGTVVLDANIGAVFARMAMVDPPPERQVFLNMLMGLIQRQRLSAPPKLMHRYSVSNHGADKILIPYARMGEGDKQMLGEISQKLMDWIVESKFELARQPSKSMDFLVTMLQCAFLYKSTILLTNNKDYFFFSRIAKDMNHWLASKYPQQASLIDLETVRLVFVQEQMKLDVYRLFKQEKSPPNPKLPATSALAVGGPAGTLAVDGRRPGLGNAGKGKGPRRNVSRPEQEP